MYPKDINIRANNISAAAREILGVLESTDKANVIYFDGWHRCGASAALNVVAQRLKSSKTKFDKVIHVDCSEWKSKRALQRRVAEELELPISVIAIFDWHDEDDDFNGVEEGSRGVISDVTRDIFQKLANSRFVVIFHNGSGGYIDLYECGIPITSFLSNKVLWTWRGRFRLLLKLEDGEEEKMVELTDAIIRTSDEGINDEAFWDLLCEEAREVVNYIGIPRSKMSHMMVEECFLYAVALGCAGNINWGTHASNYWVCDGIIQGLGDTSAWEIGDALHRNMHSQWLLQETPIQREANDAIRHCLQRMPRDRWVSTTHQDILQDASIIVLHVELTSLFLLANEPYSMMILPASMFQPSDSSRLRVLHLSWCTFHFASPPFHYCSQLRFLLLDHCTNITDKVYQSQNQNISCFQKLWVLDLRYTDCSWLLSEKMMRLMVDLRELNLEGVKNWSITDLCGSGTSLVKLRVIVDPIPTEQKDTYIEATIPDLSSASNLKTIILDGCVGLEQVAHDFLPPWIESFSFINKAAVAAKISSISVRGCSKLKDVLLRGLLGSLQELDLSGTAVKTLDLREVEAPNLKCLTMLGCRKLCAILWPPETKKAHVLEVLHVSTTQSTKLGTSPFASFDFAWHIFVRDARLLRSILPTEEPSYAHLEIDSSPTSIASVGGSTISQGARNIWQHEHYLYARDAAFQGHMQAIGPNEGVIRWMWDCPAIPNPEDEDLYIHIQDEEDMKSGLLQLQGSTKGTSTTSAALSPDLICEIAQMLHVHDCLSITSIPFQRDLDWCVLRWCRVERCPELCSVFATPQEIDGGYVFRLLTTFWASQLPMACYIWNWSEVAQPGGHSFEDLVFLHLDYSPRLIHVLPMAAYMTTLHSLETLEIVCCGDLREVFPLDPERQEQQEIIEFPELRYIHFYELPKLRFICGNRMSAPNLETVKIRGCWSLERLPAVSGNTTKRPKVDCEKDWWDNLQWDGVEANHDPSLYEPHHSRYYKKAHLARGTLLR